MRSLLVSIACAAALASLATVAGAQDQPKPTAPSTVAPGAASPSNISDAKLDAAAAAVKSVSTVKDDYEQRIARAPEKDRERLATEATQALSKAVTDNGLSVDEYTAILEVAQNDPTIRDKILQRLK
jgi:hypothetical protein